VDYDDPMSEHLPDQPDDPARVTAGNDASASGRGPRISVVLATWNAAGTLQAALDSIFEQTYRDLEVVVADGGSTDGTVAILERNSDRIAWWASARDNGVYDAWNTALAHATGDYLCFLGADDVYHAPDTMAQVAAAILADAGQHRILYGSVLFHHPDGRIWHNRSRAWGKKKRSRFRRGEMVPHPATFHHRSVFNELGGFDTSFRISGDYEFLLRAFAREAPARIDVIVLDMAAGGLSTAPAFRVLQVREVYRARYKNGAARLPPWASPRHGWNLVRTWWRWQGKPRLTGHPPT
jgi:glycosyltransferase involved in cell wall biosynthesis